MQNGQENSGKKKSTLKEDAFERPLYFSVIFLLLAAACILFPTKWLSKYIGEMLALGIVRFVFGIAGVIFMILLGLGKCFKVGRDALKNADIIAAALLVALVNFPIAALIRGEARITANAGEICKFVFFCVSVGFFEEVYFRGLIFPLLFSFFKDKKNAMLKAVLTSGAVFGLIHIVNLFGGADIGSVALQVGYSALNGLMYAVMLIFTRSLIFPILGHFLFDVGGLMIERLGVGDIWNVFAVVSTAVVAVSVAAWITFRFFRKYVRGKSAGEESEINEIF